MLARENEWARVCLIDFGLARPYKSVDEAALQERNGDQLVSFFGTLSYASINAHRGIGEPHAQRRLLHTDVLECIRPSVLNRRFSSKG